MKVKHLLLIVLYIILIIYYIPTFDYAFFSKETISLFDKFGIFHSIVYCGIFVLTITFLLLLTWFLIHCTINIFTGELEIPFITKFLNKKIT